MPKLKKGSNYIVVKDKDAKQFLDNGWVIDKPVEKPENKKNEKGE